MTEESQLSSTLVEKHSCCNVHLKPLLERINTMEHKLLIETERRENEYNELLHILLTVKKQKKDENSPGKSNIQAAKPISKLVVASQHPSKKSKQANVFSTTEAKGSSKGKSAKKSSKPLRRSSQSVKKIQITAPSQPIQNQKLSKDESIAQTLQKHNDEMNKLKQLSNYLMEQLLILFEKVKQVQAENNHLGTPKNIPTQETITSIVFDASQKQAMIKNENLAIDNQTLEQKIQRLQSMIINNNNAIREQHTKISEHESMLSQLIALTRGLSNRIVEIPLYLNSSSYDASPNKT